MTPVGYLHGDLALIEPKVGTDRTSPEVGAVAEDGIADVVIVRCLHFIEEQAVLKLTRVPQHAALAHDDIAANEGTGADLGFGPDIGRADDRGISRQFDGRMDPDPPLDMDAGWDFQVINAKFGGLQRRADFLHPKPRGDIGREKRLENGQGGRQE